MKIVVTYPGSLVVVKISVHRQLLRISRYQAEKIAVEFDFNVDMDRHAEHLIFIGLDEKTYQLKPDSDFADGYHYLEGK